MNHCGKAMGTIGKDLIVIFVNSISQMKEDLTLLHGLSHTWHCHDVNLDWQNGSNWMFEDRNSTQSLPQTTDGRRHPLGSRQEQVSVVFF